MQQTALNLFFILSSIIVLVLIGGIILFVVQYRNRQRMYNHDTALLQEKHLREMTEAKIEIQQLTMEDIGRELHDNVAQKFTLAALYSRQNASQDGTYIVSDLLDDALKDLRTLSKILTENNHDLVELHPPIKELCDKMNAFKICHVQYLYKDVIKVNAKTSRFLTRILQEFMQNSMKHSGCDVIIISANTANEKLIIEANDNGKGFDVEASFEGIGLKNMRKRTELLEGQLLMESNASGTKIKIVIPNH
jgi:signal transduction histidine kinase